MQNVLVTGGAGFVGSHLVETLVEDGFNVVVVDDFSNGLRNNLESCSDKIKIIEFDISSTDWNAIDGFNPDVIFHLATHPRSFSLSDPKKNLEVNALGTLNTLEFAKKKNSKFIYTSNSGICGDPKFFPVTEDHTEDCKTPYDANKLVGEHYAKIYHRIHGVYTITFRLATVYGERQRINPQLGWHPLVAQLVHDIESGKQPVINWDGEQTRDLIHVEDVVKCLILGSKSNEQGGEMFLVSTNIETSVNQAFEIICKISRKTVNPIRNERIQGDIRRMCLSYDKARKAFRFEPDINFETGVKKYIDWYKKNIKS